MLAPIKSDRDGNEKLAPGEALPSVTVALVLGRYAGT
jgi:hypothetical protein